MLDLATCLVLGVTVAIVGIVFHGGLPSRDFAGVIVLVAVRATMYPSHWKRGLVAAAATAGAWPATLALGSLYVPELHRQWASQAAVGEFAYGMVCLEDLEQRADRALDLILDGHVDDAEAMAHDLMRDFPREVEGIDLLSMVSEARGERERAVDAPREQEDEAGLARVLSALSIAERAGWEWLVTRDGVDAHRGGATPMRAPCAAIICSDSSQSRSRPPYDASARLAAQVAGCRGGAEEPLTTGSRV